VAVETVTGVSLVLDAGTGLRNVGALLGGRPFQGTLLLGHLHWDHTHGLPFAPALDHPDASVRLLAPAAAGDDVEALLERILSPPHFPITPAELQGKWTFERMEPGTHHFEGLTVLAREIPHKGGLTFGYRVADGAAEIAYLSDHAPQMLGDGPDGVGAYHEAALELTRDVDLLIHDAQYTVEELPQRGGYGHAAAEYAVGLGRAAGVRRVALFHPDPRRTDDEIDAILARFGDDAVPVMAAAEGLVVEL
jgi:ribonuclease BN (tRNA processing enzyme)